MYRWEVEDTYILVKALVIWASTKASECKRGFTNQNSFFELRFWLVGTFNVRTRQTFAGINPPDRVSSLWQFADATLAE